MPPRGTEQPKRRFGSHRTVDLCSSVGVASPGAPSPLKVVSFLRNLSPSGPHVMPVGLSGALEDSIPARVIVTRDGHDWALGGAALPRAGPLMTRKEGV